MNVEISQPDLQQLTDQLNKIKPLALRVEALKVRIDKEVGDIALHFQHPDNWDTNTSKPKPYAMNFLEKTYLKNGIEKEYTNLEGEKVTGLYLKYLRWEHIKLSEELSETKALFYLWKDFIGIWQTQEANKRAYLMS